jgi:hypothetical protein
VKQFEPQEHPTSRQELSRMLHDETAKWMKVVKEARIKVE